MGLHLVFGTGRFVLNKSICVNAKYAVIGL